MLLSGGIDSAALTALAAAESGYQVSTFSIGFEEQSFDELELARLVAKRYGTDHHELVLRPDAVDLLPRLVEAFDEPFGDSSALPTYLVSQLASDTVKVVLSGEGGDELFGGYYTYVADRLAPRVGRAAPFLRPLVERLPSSSGKVELRLQGQALRPRRPPAAGRAPPRLEGDLLRRRPGRAAQRPADHRPARRLPGALRGDRRAREELARLQDLDLGIYLVDDLLVKTDRASMAHSLEARVPFLDPVVAELALALETQAEGPRLLQEAAAPPGRGAAPSAGRSSAAASRGSRSRSRPGCGAISRRSRATFSRRETVERQGYLDPVAVTRVLDDHISGKEDLSRQIWGLLNFTLWFDRYAREPAATGAAAEKASMPDTIDALFGFIFAGAAVWALVPATESLAKAIGPRAMDVPNERSLHEVPTPKLGGLAVLVAVLIGGTIFLPWDQRDPGDPGGRDRDHGGGRRRRPGRSAGRAQAARSDRARRSSRSPRESPSTPSRCPSSGASIRARSSSSTRP